MVFTTGLFIYHTKLIVSNMTTKEELKHFFDNLFGNPYKRNTKMHLKQILFPAIEKKSIIDVLTQVGMNRTLNNTIAKKNEELIELSAQKSPIEDVDTDNFNNSSDLRDNNSNIIETEENNKEESINEKNTKQTNETQEKANNKIKRIMQNNDENIQNNKAFLPTARKQNEIVEEKKKEETDSNQMTKYRLPKRKKKIESKAVDMDEININLSNDNGKQD